MSWVVLHNWWPQAVAESFLLSLPRNVHSNWTFTVMNWWVLRDIGEKWCEECYNIPVFNDLTELNEHLAVEIPPSARVYPCRHATAIPIVVMCVDNNELKTMAKRTCTRLDFFPQSVKWNRNGTGKFSSSYLGWGMLDNTQMVQNLWIKINDSFYLSKVFTSRKVRFYQLWPC